MLKGYGLQISLCRLVEFSLWGSPLVAPPTIRGVNADAPGSELPKPEILKLIGVSSTMATYFNASVGVHKSDVGVPSRLGSIPAGLPVPTIPYPTARGFVGKVLFFDANP